MGWAGHRRGEKRRVNKILVGKSMENRSDIRGIVEKMGSEWILGTLVRGFRVDSIGSV
jgi:hypothetical protein